MDIAVGDIIQTRKKHPCGASSFEVLRVGMDFRIRCTGCGREVMLPRVKIEKNIKKVIRPDGLLARRTPDAERSAPCRCLWINRWRRSAAGLKSWPTG